MKKRILAIVCCAVMLLLAGCGSKTTEPEQGQENGENTNTVENFKPQKIVISHNSASSNPEPTALAWFAEELEKRTDGICSLPRPLWAPGRCLGAVITSAFILCVTVCTEFPRCY